MNGAARPDPEGAGNGSPAAPGVLVILGASGDLTRRMLIPALLNLGRDGMLPDRFAILGVAATAMRDEDFRDHLKSYARERLGDAYDQGTWEWLARRIGFVTGELHDPDTYRRLGGRLQETEAQWQTGPNRIYYLALPPSLFTDTVTRLAAERLLQRGGPERVVIEKPFGHDLDSAVALDRRLAETLAEEQIFRIDHYLGKETVQNLLVFRFANAIFEPLWNRHYIDHVQISVAEQIGIGHRGRYYEEAGALRDMVPNHVMQLLSFTAMEPPASFDAQAVHDKKAEVLEMIQPLSAEDVIHQTVRGQYGAGTVNGQAVAGYRGEDGVAPDSKVETFVAMRLMLDNWRWAGVPFYLRTGKRMPQRLTEIVIQFRPVPFTPFRHTPTPGLIPNQLVIRIQPREGIFLRFGAKRPGPSIVIGNVDMDFCYADYFGALPSSGYETLLYDALNGDATLFQRADGIEGSWGVVEPVLDVWSALPPRDFPNYAAGSWGPQAADALLARDGRAWKNG